MSVDACRQERELREQWQRLHELVHQSESKALETAKGSIDQRLDEMNALRLQITQERGEFISRDLYDREHTSLREQFDVRVKALENSNANMQGRIWMMGAVISLIVSLLTVALHFWK